VADILREFHWKLRPSVDERIHLNILHAANDLECVRKLVELTKRDWRDVIVATEYELKRQAGTNGMVQGNGTEKRSAVHRCKAIGVLMLSPWPMERRDA
jgi:hypothetical protein